MSHPAQHERRGFRKCSRQNPHRAAGVSDHLVNGPTHTYPEPTGPRLSKNGSAVWPEIVKTFRRKKDAEDWLAAQQHAINTGTHVDPRKAERTFCELVEAWRDERWASFAPSTRARSLEVLKNHLGVEFGDDAHAKPTKDGGAFGRAKVGTIDREAVRRYFGRLGRRGRRGRAIGRIGPQDPHRPLLHLHGGGRGGHRRDPPGEPHPRTPIRSPAAGNAVSDGAGGPRARRCDQPGLSHAHLHGRVRRPAVGRVVRTPPHRRRPGGRPAPGVASDQGVARRRAGIRPHQEFEAARGPGAAVPRGNARRAAAVVAGRDRPQRARVHDDPRHQCHGLRAIRREPFVTNHFRPVVKAVVPDKAKLRLHDLRHTYAALMIAQGAQPMTLKALMGHASITTTLDRDGHLFPGHDDGVMDGLDATFNRRRGARQRRGTPRDLR